jgi:molecular chaperone DnaK
MDIFQGDSEFIVDNEYLGTVKVPVGPAGRKIDFRLNEECLLKLVIDEAGSQKQVTLATRDTPESLRKALEEDQRERPQGSDLGSQGRRGLLSGFKRMLGRG